MSHNSCQIFVDDNRFQLVEFQLRYVLSKAEPRKIVAALESVPSDLPEAYENVFNRIERRGAEYCKLVLKILSWIFYARRLLRMNELQHALAMEPEDIGIDDGYLLQPNFIVEVSESLLSYDKATGIVRLSHHTVREYLQGSLTSLLSETDLSLVCITYLSFDVFSQGPCKTRSSLMQRLQDFPFALYAGNYWGTHACVQDELRIELVTPLMKLFATRSQLNSLLQLQSLIENMSSTEPDLQRFLTNRKLLRYIEALGHPLFDISFFQRQSALHLVTKQRLGTIARVMLDLRSARPPVSDYERTVSESSRKELNKFDGNNETPLQIAARLGYEEIVEILLEAGSSTDARKEERDTALHLATEKNHIKIVTLLVNAGANVDIQNEDGRTALHIAADDGKLEITRLLCDAGAYVDLQDHWGYTALHMAAMIGHEDVVGILLNEYNADPGIRDEDECTAGHLASINGNKYAAMMLNNYGWSLDSD